MINQHAQINRTHDILQDDTQCEMIITIDNHRTSTAKYSDILLPDCTTSEQMDFAFRCLCIQYGLCHFCRSSDQTIFECRPIYDMLSDLAEKWA